VSRPAFRARVAPRLQSCGEMPAAHGTRLENCRFPRMAIDGSKRMNIRLPRRL